MLSRDARFLAHIAFQRILRRTYLFPLLTLWPSVSLFLSLSHSLGARVARWALWWLLRWLRLEAIQAAHKTAPRRVKELPREQVHLPPSVTLYPLCLVPSYLRFYLFSLITAEHVGCTFTTHLRTCEVHDPP